MTILKWNEFEINATSMVLILLLPKKQEILTHDRVQNASSRKKNLVESQNVLNKGARLFFGIVFIFVSLSSFSSDSVFVGLILLGVSGYLLKPFVSDLD